MKDTDPGDRAIHRRRRPKANVTPFKQGNSARGLCIDTRLGLKPLRISNFLSMAQWLGGVKSLQILSPPTFLHLLL